MLLALALLVNGYIKGDCNKDYPPKWRFDTGYINTVEIQSLVPDESCQHKQFCIINFQHTTPNGSRYEVAEGTCTDVATKIKSSQ